VGVFRDCPNFLSRLPPIISGTLKATNFKFCTHILSIDRNKSPLQISGKVAGCVVRTLEIVQGTHILGASRVIFAIAQLSCLNIGYLPLTSVLQTRYY